MKKLETLENVMEFIYSKHRRVKGRPGGLHGYKMYRRADGARILFEEVVGFRIFKHESLNDNSMLLTTMAAGIQFKGKEKISVESRLYLTDLVVVKIFDHSAEFYTSHGLDFVYVEQDFSGEIQMMNQWISGQSDTLRAQWVAKADIVDRILDELTGGPKVPQEEESRRFIDMSYGD